MNITDKELIEKCRDEMPGWDIHISGIDLINELIKRFEERKPFSWLPIDPDNLPLGEVLAACFKEGTGSFQEKTIGYIAVIEGIISCENDHELLLEATHYIDIHAHDEEVKNGN